MSDDSAHGRAAGAPKRIGLDITRELLNIFDKERGHSYVPKEFWVSLISSAKIIHLRTNKLRAQLLVVFQAKMSFACAGARETRWSNAANARCRA